MRNGKLALHEEEQHDHRHIKEERRAERKRIGSIFAWGEYDGRKILF